MQEPYIEGSATHTGPESCGHRPSPPPASIAHKRRGFIRGRDLDDKALLLHPASIWGARPRSSRSAGLQVLFI